MSFEMVYHNMRRLLENMTAQPVLVVPSNMRDWARLGLTHKWEHLLRKLEQTLREAIEISTSGKVTIIGHSAGGVMSRIYLGSTSMGKETRPGKEYVDRLITLGSPHRHAVGATGGWVSQWVNEHYPGAFFAPEVEYISVSGRSTFGDPRGDLRERHAYPIYRMVGGEGKVWGDGIVPTDCALLPGARHLILDGVTHYKICGSPWYGETEEAIASWWPKAGPDTRDQNNS